jgi:hypothetical protein
MAGRTRELFEALEALGVPSKLCPSDKALAGEPLMQRVMQCWLPAGTALLEMVVRHLPSPVKAQKVRVDTFYQGPMSDAAATAIRNCDPSGPLVVFISCLIPSGADMGRFLAFGRVFSGTICSGQKVSSSWCIHPCSLEAQGHLLVRAHTTAFPLMHVHATSVPLGGEGAGHLHPIGGCGLQRCGCNAEGMPLV